MEQCLQNSEKKKLFPTNTSILSQINTRTVYNMEVLKYNLPNHLSYKSLLEDVLHQNKELNQETGTKETQNRGHNLRKRKRISGWQLCSNPREHPVLNHTAHRDPGEILARKTELVEHLSPLHDLDQEFTIFFPKEPVSKNLRLCHYWEKAAISNM